MTIILLAGLVLSMGCEPPASQRSPELQDEIASREIKKIPEGTIMAKAGELGEQLAAKTQATLAENLKQALKDSGVKGAIEFCNVQAYPLVDSIEKNMDISIRRTSLRIRNAQNTPNDLEARILEAYQYNFENDQELTDNLQKIDDEYLLYTKPIVISNAVCLNCHGQVGQQVTEDVNHLLKSLYPEDHATGFKKGDLRGMWSIKIARKAVISQL